MPKFRKKPVVVEAEQFTGEFMLGVCWSPDRKDIDCYTIYGDGRTNPHVHTMHSGQTVTLEAGDWVIREPDGHYYYPVKPEVFDATYEPVEDAPLPDDRADSPDIEVRRALLS